MDTGGSDALWAPKQPARTSPSLLAGYRDFVQIARGGDSVVYRAHQEALDRDVAVKVVEVSDPDTVARFRRELAITVQLGRQHPNIMTVLATGTTADGQPCLVMDYVELGSLHDRLVSHGPLPVSEVVAAGTVIADALAFAHGQGVLHRDVKPQNVLVLPTSWVLADFGLARAVDAGHSTSLERFSYRHASPQILDGLAPSTADDIYSLGSTLFTLLDGRAPFAAADPDEDSALGYLRRARTDVPRAQTRDDVPAALREVVARCLARERGERFADAASLRDALAAVPTESRAWSPPASEPPRRAPEVTEVAVEPDTPTGPPTTRIEKPASQVPAEAVAFAPADEAAFEKAAFAPADDPREQVAHDSHAPLVRPTAGRPVADRSDAEELAPPPPAPSPSALAALPPTRAAADGEPTGARPVETEAADLGAPTTTSRRWPVLVGIAVLAVGAGVGIGFWRGSGGDSRAVSHPSPTASPAGTPTATPSPTVTATPVALPALMITGFQAGPQNTVELRWSDPGQGRYRYVVLEVLNGSTVPTPTQPNQGQTSFVVPNVPSGRHCYAIGMLVPGGTSPLQLGQTTCRTI